MGDGRGDAVSAGMADLVSALEGVWVDPLSTDLGVIAAALEERQEILDRIQRADARSLSVEERSTLFARLRAVLTRDDLLRRNLEEQQAKVREALTNLAAFRASRAAPAWPEESMELQLARPR